MIKKFLQSPELSLFISENKTIDMGDHFDSCHSTKIMQDIIKRRVLTVSKHSQEPESYQNSYQNSSKRHMHSPTKNNSACIFYLTYSY